MDNAELILNDDGSIYHLNLTPDDIAPTIFLVGDPGRVAKVSHYFDSIEVKKEKREFVTHTGTYKGKKLMVISTGIGTDNIDIVFNELDALVNIDLETKTEKAEKTSLNFIRLGTSGSLNPKVDAGAILLSDYAVGFDGLMKYYASHRDHEYKETFLKDFPYPQLEPLLYFSRANKDLLAAFQQGLVVGNTGSLPGFYGPQGRELRLKSIDKEMLAKLYACGLDNFEMETSGIYAFAHMLGHKALSVNAILANRTLGTFVADPKALVDDMIKLILEKTAAITLL